MASSVPFALLAAIQLLAVAGWLALAAASLFPGARSVWSVPVAIGGGCLAFADALTGSLGTATSPGTTGLRAAGAVILALGLIRGAPAGVRPRRRSSFDAPGTGGAAPLLAVAPVAMATGGGLTAGLALLAAAGLTGAGAVRSPGVAAHHGNLRRRPIGSALLSAGLLCAAVAALVAVAVSPGSDSQMRLPEVVLIVRGVGALLVLGYVARVASTSLLAKVVSSIMAGLVLASIVVAAVVGTVVNNRLGTQQTTQVSAVAGAETKSLGALTQTTIVLANALASATTETAAASVAQESTSLNTGQKYIAVEVKLDSKTGKPVLSQAYVSTGVDRAQLLSLATSEPVVAALDTRGGLAQPPPANLQVLEGATPAVVLATVATPTTPPTRRPLYVRVFGILVDHQLLQTSNNNPDFNTTLVDLASGQVAGSSLDAKAAAALALDRRVRSAVANPPDVEANVAELSSGNAPTLGLATLQTGPDPAALLVVSASSAVVSGTQKVLLQVLFISLLASAALVAVLALLVGARIVEPVRRLTLAAERVRRGDLAVTTGGSGRDEVGRLSRTFDEMTRSLVQADTDLRASVVQETAVRSRLETVLESIADGLVVVGAEGTVESINPAAEALLGPADTVVGVPLAEAVRGVPLESRMAEGLLLATGGRRVPVIVSSEALADGSGRVLVLRDTSREREVERMKTEFLSNVSHELRTPLTPIRGYAGILAGRELPPAKVAEYATVMLASSQRLTRVVDLLVEVAALDAGRVTPEPDRVGLGGFVDERLAAWRTRAPARAGDLRRRIPAGMPEAFVDGRWLAKAVDELIDNAVKFSPAGSPITLAAGVSPDGARVRLEVRDLGEGIPEDRRDALFLDFEQVDGSATRSRDGLGLGLPFVRRVADVVGLRLGVTSTPGRGSVFSLEVPAAPAKGPKPPTQRRRTTLGNRRSRAGLSPTP